jgi:phospholipase C
VRRRSRGLAIVAVLVALAAACTRAKATGSDGGPANPTSPSGDASISTSAPDAKGIFKLEHLIFIVQENRSFDQYFGTYPDADGIATNPDGSFAACVPDPFQDGKCVTPYVTHDIDQDGGPHTHPASVHDVDGGKMDGFISALGYRPEKCWVDRTRPECAERLGPDGQPDIMSTHTRATIPNYWRYADQFVLQDRMFAPTDSWTLPSHLFLVSAWSAFCPDPRDPMSCRTNINLRHDKMQSLYTEPPAYGWTDITWLLDEQDVSWAYYVGNDTCSDPPCARSSRHNYRTGFGHNPLPGFSSFRERDGFRDNVLHVDRYLDATASGALPSVSWIAPSSMVSDHPGGPSTTRTSMAYVTRLVNAAMRGPEWESTAIFITWDDWGGFYDHVEPPRIDNMGYGLRVPGLVISPYAKRGYVDDTTLSFDSYLRLIEDRFLGGARLDPKTMSRPDSRPTVREDVAKSVRNAFDFTQEPRGPVMLDPWPWRLPEHHSSF